MELLITVHAASAAFEEALPKQYAKTAAATRASAVVDGITSCVRFLYEHSEELADPKNHSAEYQEAQHAEHAGTTCAESIRSAIAELVVASLDALGREPVAPAAAAALAEYAQAARLAAVLLAETSGAVPYVDIVQRPRRRRAAAAAAADAGEPPPREDVGAFAAALRRHSLRLLANLPVYDAGLQSLFATIASDESEDAAVRENAIRGLAHGAASGRIGEKSARQLAAALAAFAAPSAPEPLALEAAKAVHNVAVRCGAARAQLAEFVPRSIAWLSHPEPSQQTIACTVLTHLVVANETAAVERIANAEVVRASAALLKSQYPDLPKFALVLLRNLAAVPPMAPVMLDLRSSLLPLILAANRAASRLSGDDALLAEVECMECAHVFGNLAATGPEAAARLLAEPSLVRAAAQWLAARDRPGVQQAAITLCFNLASHAAAVWRAMLGHRTLLTGLADVLREGTASREAEDDVVRIFGTLYFQAGGGGPDRPLAPLCAPRAAEAPAEAERGADPEAALDALFRAGALPGLARLRTARGPPPCPPKGAGPRGGRRGPGGAKQGERAAAAWALAAVVEELATALAGYSARAKALDRARRGSLAAQLPFVAAVLAVAAAAYFASRLLA